MAPDMNRGGADFAVKDGNIVFGLTAIKGLGRGTAEEIVRARHEKGRFRDLYDFCERVDLKVVGKAAMERLIKAGAFDAFGRRAALWAVLPKAIQSAGEAQQDRKRGQRNFFDVLDAEAPEDSGREPEPLPDIPEWAETERLKFEKEALDFYFSSHPLAQYEAELKRFTTHACDKLREAPDGAEVRLGGMLTMIRYFTTKKGGKRYVRCKVEDFTGTAECVMWNEEYERHAKDFVDDRVCLAEARVEKGERDEPILQLLRIISLEQARKELTRSMILKLNLGVHTPECIDGVARVLRRAPGGCQVFLKLIDGAGKVAALKLNDEFRVHPGQVSVDDLETILGRGCVEFSAK
jgi:DNA polymerase-3 subunit alpha